MGFINGLMEEDMKGTIFKIKNTVKEYIIGQMVDITKVTGSMGSSMVKESLQIVTECQRLEYGKMAN